MGDGLVSILLNAINIVQNDLQLLLPPIGMVALALGAVLYVFRMRKTGSGLVIGGILCFIVYCLNNDIFAYIQRLFGSG